VSDKFTSIDAETKHEVGAVLLYSNIYSLCLYDAKYHKSKAILRFEKKMGHEEKHKTRRSPENSEHTRFWWHIRRRTYRHRVTQSGKGKEMEKRGKKWDCRGP